MIDWEVLAKTRAEQLERLREERDAHLALFKRLEDEGDLWSHKGSNDPESLVARAVGFMKSMGNCQWCGGAEFKTSAPGPCAACGFPSTSLWRNYNEEDRRLFLREWLVEPPEAG